jgi:hypothetical protein
MSKVFTKSGFMAAAEANKITPISNDKLAVFNRLWIWTASVITDGKRVANVGDIYIGERTESGDCTPDVLTKDDLAFLIELPLGETKLLRDVLFQADNIGDGVYFKYW